MDKDDPLKTQMVVWYLDPNKDLFYLKETDEHILHSKVPYLNVIGALIYWTMHTLSLNVSARFSSEPIRQHYNGVIHIFHYIHRNIDLSLFNSNELTKKLGLVGYVDACYLSDPHKVHRWDMIVLTMVQ